MMVHIQILLNGQKYPLFFLLKYLIYTQTINIYKNFVSREMKMEGVLIFFLYKKRKNYY